eukprot:5592321-Amphidinium_carterae.1
MGGCKIGTCTENSNASGLVAIFLKKRLSKDSVQCNATSQMKTLQKGDDRVAFARVCFRDASMDML